MEWQTERCAWRAREEREGAKEKGREREREVKRGERAPADASKTRTNDFVLWAAKVICSLDMQSQWFSYVVPRTRVIPGRASSILLPSLRDFEISFAPLLEGEFSSFEKGRGREREKSVCRSTGISPRCLVTVVPSLPPLFCLPILRA